MILIFTVLGGWSGWDEWNMCSSVCGSGYHIRVRACSHPLPIGEENECPGDRYEKQACVHESDECDQAPADRGNYANFIQDVDN